MAHYGVLRNVKFEAADDIRGDEVYGVNNEKLGQIDDVIFDHASGEIRYLVVDTGGWLESRKFLVPAGRIQPYGSHEDKFYADLDKERIQMLPEYSEAHLDSEELWAEYEQRYEHCWSEGARMHEPNARLEDMPHSHSTAGAPPGAYGRRWIDFQQKLRQGRDKVVSECPLCGSQEKAA